MQTQPDTTPHDCSLYDIIVVGAGPAGLCFINALKGSHLRIAVVEMQSQDKLANPHYDGREIALTHPSVSILKQLGIWSYIAPDDVFRLKEAKVFDGNSRIPLHFKLPVSQLNKQLKKKNINDRPKDRLGFLVSNHLIKKAAYKAAYDASESLHNGLRLDWFTETRIDSIDLARHDSTAPVSVTTDQGNVLQGKLLVAADSRFSCIRSQMGISSDRHDFAHSALLCRISHTLSNQETATETFAYGNTLAVLPLSPYLSNCVITAPTDQINHLSKLPEDERLAHINHMLKRRLGDLSLAGSTHVYPLVAVHAQHFVTTKSALIGDAAVGLHPVTAHGFNLGLHSATTLASLIIRQVKAGGAITDIYMLRQYERRHMLKTRPMYHGTNAIVNLFTTDNPPVKLMRKAVLFGSDKLPPLKWLITKQLTG